MKTKIKYKFNFSALLFNLLICSLFLTGLTPLVGAPTAAVFSGSIFALGLIPSSYKLPVGVLRNEVVTTIFSSELQKNIFPDNAFYKNSKVDAGVAINAVSVQIPQAGTPPNTLLNPDVLPVKARIRKDDILSYNVDQIVTEVDIVTDVNQAIVSYDKKGGVLEDHINTINTRVASEIPIRWAPTLSTNFKASTGGGNSGSLYTGMTGTRKELTYQDFIDLCTLMDNMNVPDDGQRCMLIWTSQVSEIKKIAEFRDFDKTGIAGQFQNGSLGRVQNMNVYKRSVPLLFSSANVVKAYGSAVATTDKIGIIAWHPSFVRRAEGVAQVYYEAKKPGYQGDIMNAAVRFGGTKSRKDEVGVAVLVQG